MVVKLRNPADLSSLNALLSTILRPKAALQMIFQLPKRLAFVALMRIRIISSSGHDIVSSIHPFPLQTHFVVNRPFPAPTSSPQSLQPLPFDLLKPSKHVLSTLVSSRLPSKHPLHLSNRSSQRRLSSEKRSARQKRWRALVVGRELVLRLAETQIFA